MIKTKNVIVLDIDGTICEIDQNKEYSELLPIKSVVNKMWEYKNEGWTIILNTSRNMKTFDGNIGLINVKTAKTLSDWLEKHKIPYDEIMYGKPWCGSNGFYVDDKSIRPDEFSSMSYKEITELLGNKNGKKN